MRSADPMILICDDREDRARAWPHYAASPARPAISLRPLRRGMGGHRAAAARPVPPRPAAGEVAGERPLVCVVDDEQWLDQASVQALGAGRRVAADARWAWPSRPGVYRAGAAR